MSRNGSELLENPEEMFPRYYVDSDIINRFIPATTHWCVTRRERVSYYLASLLQSIYYYNQDTYISWKKMVSNTP